MDRMYKQSIKSVTTGNTDQYEIGNIILGQKIHEIKFHSLYCQGDPFLHICGFSNDGEILFSINCLIPCEIIYLHNDRSE